MMVTSDLAVRWTAWIDLLERHGFAIRAVLQPGASDADLDALERATALRLTDEIRAFYRLNNGQRTRPTRGAVRDGLEAPWPPRAAGLFGFYEFLGTQEAAGAWQRWMSVADQQGPAGMREMAEFVTVAEPEKVKCAYWTPGWLPFARDGGGNALAFDLDPEPGGTVGQVVLIGPDEDHRHVFAPSTSELLACLIAEWQDGRFEIDDEGDDRYYDLPFLHPTAP